MYACMDGWTDGRMYTVCVLSMKSLHVNEFLCIVGHFFCWCVSLLVDTKRLICCMSYMTRLKDVPRATLLGIKCENLQMQSLRDIAHKSL